MAKSVDNERPEDSSELPFVVPKEISREKFSPDFLQNKTVLPAVAIRDAMYINPNVVGEHFPRLAQLPVYLAIVDEQNKANNDIATEKTATRYSIVCAGYFTHPVNEAALPEASLVELLQNHAAIEYPILPLKLYQALNPDNSKIYLNQIADLKELFTDEPNPLLEAAYPSGKVHEKVYNEIAFRLVSNFVGSDESEELEAGEVQEVIPESMQELLDLCAKQGIRLNYHQLFIQLNRMCSIQNFKELEQSAYSPNEKSIFMAAIAYWQREVAGFLTFTKFPREIVTPPYRVNLSVGLDGQDFQTVFPPLEYLSYLLDNYEFYFARLPEFINKTSIFDTSLLRTLVTDLESFLSKSLVIALQNKLQQLGFRSKATTLHDLYAVATTSKKLSVEIHEQIKKEFDPFLILAEINGKTIPVNEYQGVTLGRKLDFIRAKVAQKVALSIWEEKLLKMDEISNDHLMTHAFTQKKSRRKTQDPYQEKWQQPLKERQARAGKRRATIAIMLKRAIKGTDPRQ